MTTNRRLMCPSCSEDLSIREDSFVCDGCGHTITLDEVLEWAKQQPGLDEVVAELERRENVFRFQSTVSRRSQVAIGEAYSELSLISAEQLEAASADTVFIEARELLANHLEGTPYSERVMELYHGQLPAAIRRLEGLASGMIELLSVEPVRNRYRDLWLNDRVALGRLNMHCLPSDLSVNRSTDRYIVRSLVEVVGILEYFEGAPEPFILERPPADTSPEGGEFRVDLVAAYDRSSYRAYRIFDPLWYLEAQRFEPEHIKFAFKWVGGVVNSEQYWRLVRAHCDGLEIGARLIELYESGDRLEELCARIRNSLVIQQYAPMVEDIAANVRAGRYPSACVTLFAVVEGVLWNLAWWWSTECKKPLLQPPLTRAEFESHRTFKLLRPDGNTIKASIGSLLMHTELGAEIPDDLVEYLVLEFYRERNRVLHGRVPQYGDREKAGTLLFALEVVERTITRLVAEHYGNSVHKWLSAQYEAGSPKP